MGDVTDLNTLVSAWLENNLGWHVQTQNTSNSTKAEKRLNMFKMIKFKLPRRTLEKMYFSVVKPI